MSFSAKQQRLKTAIEKLAGQREMMALVTDEEELQLHCIRLAKDEEEVQQAQKALLTA